ncbi:MAG: amino acid permease [Acidobacteriota bacterium]
MKSVVAERTSDRLYPWGRAAAATATIAGRTRGRTFVMRQTHCRTLPPMSTDAEHAHETSEDGYLRVLSRFDGTLLVVGCIIGAGVFFTPHDVSLVVQDPRLMLGVWILGGVIALTGALTYAELGALHPKTGGVYVFMREAFGSAPAFVYGWTIMLVIAPGALAIVADFFAANLAQQLPASWQLPKTAIAAAVIVVLTWVNVRGVRWGSRVQNFFSLSKLAALALLVAGGLTYGGERVLPSADAVVPTASHQGLVGFLFAMVPVLFSYGGWQNGTFIAGEMRRPQRDVPMAICLGTLIVVVSYLTINFSFLRIMTPEAIAAERTFAATAAKAALGPFGGTLVILGILVSTFGICAAILLANPRVAQAIAGDGLFFASFARLHPRYRTPHWAIVTLGTCSIVLLFVGGAGQLLDAVVFADWVFFALTGAALPILRRRQPAEEGVFRCPGYPFVPWLFIVLATSMAVITFVRADALSRALGAGLLASGLPVYWAFARSRR